MTSGLVTPVVLAAITSNGKILLLRREREPYVGLWSLPGGKVNSSELITDAIKREVYEETELRVISVTFLGMVSELLIENKRTIAGHLIAVFRTEVEPGRVKTSDEGSLEWFVIDTLEKMKEKIVPTDYLIINEMAFSNTCQAFACLVERTGLNYSLTHVSRIQ